MLNEPLYKIEEVARRLNVSVSTLYRMVSRSRIEHHRVGCGRGSLRFSETQIRSYLDRVEMRQPPPTAARVKLKHLRL